MCPPFFIFMIFDRDAGGTPLGCDGLGETQMRGRADSSGALAFVVPFTRG